MVTVDACGLSCPEPIILLKEVIGNDAIQLMVDNQTSVETCTRFAQSKNYKVDVSQSDGVYTLTLQKG